MRNKSEFENTVENGRCGGIDDEIKNIFDDLRLIGNPQNHTLGETIGKALAMEREKLRTQAVKSIENSSFGKLFAANFRRLQVREGMFCFALTIIALLVMNLPNATNDAELQRAELKPEMICWKCY